MFTVTQIDARTTYASHTDARRSYTVTEEWVGPMRAWMNGRINRIAAESSDWVSVKEA